MLIFGAILGLPTFCDTSLDIHSAGRNI